MNENLQSCVPGELSQATERIAARLVAARRDEEACSGLLSEVMRLHEPDSARVAEVVVQVQVARRTQGVILSLVHGLPWQVRDEVLKRAEEQRGQ